MVSSVSDGEIWVLFRSRSKGIGASRLVRNGDFWGLIIRIVGFFFVKNNVKSSFTCFLFFFRLDDFRDRIGWRESLGVKEG